MIDKNQQSRKKALIYIAVVLGLLVIIGASIFVILSGIKGDFHLERNRVAVIYVQGVLLTGSIPSGFGIATSEDITESIRTANDDSTVKAIVLRINSPGGSPAAAEEIVTEIKKTNKPIVVSMGDVAASGAYYISAPADKILANPDTITGSIGVIWVFVNNTQYYEEETGIKHYIEYYVVKSGKFKDMGASWRNLTEEEKQYANQVINETYMRFVKEVAEGRNMSEDKVHEVADGRIYTGALAKNLGLIDDFGNLYDAIDLAANLSGIKGKPSVTYINKPTLSRLLFGSENTKSHGDIAKYYTRYLDESPYGQLIS